MLRNETWRAAGLIVVAIVAITNVVSLVFKVTPPLAESPVAVVDPVTRQERRLTELRQAIETRGVQGVVSYIGDGRGQELMADPRQVEDFYLAQFVLVPLVLDPGSESHEWTIVNRRTGSSADLVPSGWQITEDFGAGVLLLRKAAP